MNKPKWESKPGWRCNPIACPMLDGKFCATHSHRKVLFLDIDGVLNRNGTQERCLGFKGVDRVLSDRFVRLMKEYPDFKVVLSSTWRTDPRMFSHLNDAGITWVDMTPQTRGMLSRGQEIQLWLNEHPEINHYVILDDMDVLSLQKHLHVQTDERHGLSEDKLAELASLLKSPAAPTSVDQPLSTPAGSSTQCQPPEVKGV